MTLTKELLIERICMATGLTKNQSKTALETLFETIKGNLAGGEEVLVSGFGKFGVKEKGRRRGRNPQTGDDLMLDPRRIVSFRCSPVLREKINAAP
jgi:integration host factor subunit alpha